jgi:hypothetical protein
MVEIHYKLRHYPDEMVMKLSDENYFDSLSDGEIFSEDGIPKFSRLSEYIQTREADIEYASIALSCGLGTTVKFEQYSSDGRVWIWQRDDPEGGGELCIETRLDTSQFHLARFNLDLRKNWVPTYVGVIVKLPDGSETENKIFPVYP